MWPVPQGFPYQRLGPQCRGTEVAEPFKGWVQGGGNWVTTRGISLGVLCMSSNKNKL